MMVHCNPTVAQDAPDELCQVHFLHKLTKAHATLVERILCDSEMSEAEEARIMLDIGRIEYLTQCCRHLH